MLRPPQRHKHIYVLLALILIAIGYHLHAHTQQNASMISPSATPTTTLPPSSPNSALRTDHTDFREIIKGDTSKKQVIITVNAGFGERSAEGILAALAKHQVKATFFLVGEWVEDHPELTRRIAQEGHEIFNHSYSHPDYTLLTAAEIQADLQKMDDVLFATAGIRTRPYYRAPFGYRNQDVNLAAQEVGFQHIYWSVDSIDWREGETVESINARVLDHIHPGAIVLLHIGDIPTGDGADELFTKIKEKGYQLVSLTEGM